MLHTTANTIDTQDTNTQDTDAQIEGPNTRRSVWAVLAGLLTIFAASTATDMVMHASGIFPALDMPPDAAPMSDALFLLALAYRFVYDVAGCYLTARLAPRQPMKHALILGAIGTVLSIAGAIAMWDVGPHWYPIVLALSALPSAWLGGVLASRTS